MSLTTYLTILRIRTVAKLKALAATEPVRLRAVLTSAVLGLAVVFPAIDAGTAEMFGAVGVVALPLLVGESARRRVTPASTSS